MIHHAVLAMCDPIDASVSFPSDSARLSRAQPPSQRARRRRLASLLTCGLLLFILQQPAIGAVAGEEERIQVQSFDGAHLAATLNLPPGPGPHPAIMVIHGGLGGSGFVSLHRGNDQYVQAHLYSAGYAIFQIDYRRYAFGEVELEDVLAAYRYLQGRSEIDRTRIGVLGGSHGGYLAMMLATRVKPAATVAFAGLADIRGHLYDGALKILPQLRADPGWREKHYRGGKTIKEESVLLDKGVPGPRKIEGSRMVNEIMTDMAAQFGDDQSLWSRNNPIEQWEQMQGPLLFVVGSKDRWGESGKKLVEKLRGRGQTAEFSLHPDMPHGFYWGSVPGADGNLPDEFYRSLQRTTTFMRQWVMEAGKSSAPALPPTP